MLLWTWTKHSEGFNVGAYRGGRTVIWTPDAFQSVLILRVQFIFSAAADIYLHAVCALFGWARFSVFQQADDGPCNTSKVQVKKDYEYFNLLFYLINNNQQRSFPFVCAPLNLPKHFQTAKRKHSMSKFCWVKVEGGPPLQKRWLLDSSLCCFSDTVGGIVVRIPGVFNLILSFWVLRGSRCNFAFTLTCIGAPDNCSLHRCSLQHPEVVLSLRSLNGHSALGIHWQLKKQSENMDEALW